MSNIKNLITQEIANKMNAGVPRSRKAILADKQWFIKFKLDTECLKGGEVYLVIRGRYGGGNRHEYTEEIKEIYSNPYFVREDDWDYDCTYADAIFLIPSPNAGKLLDLYDDLDMDPKSHTEDEVNNCIKLVLDTWKEPVIALQIKILNLEEENKKLKERIAELECV